MVEAKAHRNHQETGWMATKRFFFCQGFQTTKINSSTLSVLNILEMQLKMSQMVIVAWKPSRCQLTIFLGTGMLHGHASFTSGLKNNTKNKTNGLGNIQGNKNIMRVKPS